MSNSDIDRQIEACVERNLLERKRIEQQQDRMKKERGLLNQIEDEVDMDTRRVHNILENYLYKNDPSLHNIVIAGQNEISYSQSQMQLAIDQSYQDLAVRERKLASQLEEQQREYREELRNIEKEDAQ